MRLENRHLPEEVAKEYRLVPGTPMRFVDRYYGEIDLRTISLPLARKLVQQGVVKGLRPAEKAKKKDTAKD